MEPVVLLEHILDGREKPTNLPFSLLKKITENFSEDHEIGQGGFATVYKGILPNGLVAVKRIRSNHSINPKLFYRELDSLLTVNHENVVRFLGFCASTNETAVKIEGAKGYIYAEVRERLFCLEYISNGSLQKHITDELRGLEWDARYRIVRGVCEGLHHLHRENQIYHMDLKPANILLDSRMVPKITDFGLSRLDQKSETMSEDRLGSLGYCAPEYLRSGKMSFKSDMYSLGVIIIELVTGEKDIPDDSNNNVLRRWMHRWKKTGKETPLVYQQVAKCMEVGLLCQEIDPSKRPFIWDLIHDIRKMEGVDGTISNADEYTFGQISPYSEDDMLGVEPLELHFPFKLDKQISISLKLTNQTDAYIAFNIQKMSPLPYCMQPNKGIVPPRSKCSVDITLRLRDKAPRDMQRASELIVWSTKVNDGLTSEDITINMFSKESGVVDAMNLDVVFDAEESTKISKELISCSIPEDMSNNETDGTLGDGKKSQECLLPTDLWMSSTSRQNHQEATKDSNEIQQASDKTSEIESHEELQLDMQCKNKLLVPNATASKEPSSQYHNMIVTGEMFINKADGKLADEAKSDESLLLMPTLLESSIGNKNCQEGAQVFTVSQSARDTTTETEQGDASSHFSLPRKDPSSYCFSQEMTTGSKTQENKTSPELPAKLQSDFLKKITNDFSDERKISATPFGTLYKGIYQDNDKLIAVKKLHENATIPAVTRFAKEVQNVMALNHENIVQLVGYCSATAKKLVKFHRRYIQADVTEYFLCYEYLAGGSLHQNLLGSKASAQDFYSTKHDWATRFKIIEGICRGIHFLHKLDIPIIHMDLKPENIWLDASNVPKIGNFELSVCFGQEQTETRTQDVVGSIGYMPPEYLYRGEISAKSDIYSLGLLIMEITTGEKNSPEKDQPSAWGYIYKIENRWPDLQHIASKYGLLDEDGLWQVKACIDLSLECVHIDPKKRPCIDSIVDRLNKSRAKVNNI
ncbi:hypothetical protein QYE76_036884 [Lolium multiflorum]|uniref:Protein kinase domain-containing protein n=1 Tax=Lolium multiflorum TaxID=4521 RepID=A0AAD8R3B5_LOLMU|nr:hypothetical protein QYE76_036884 [Lolium multiflorum]